MSEDEDEVARHRIADEMIRLVDGEDVEATLTAMLDCIIHVMSNVCPGCRKNIAAHLKQAIPEILSCANAAAAKRNAPQQLCDRYWICY